MSHRHPGRLRRTSIANLADPATGGNVGFTATGPGWSVTVSAFAKGAVDGLYMGVVISPISG